MLGEKLLERFLWNVRYILMLAVSGLLLGCLIFLLVGFMEMVVLGGGIALIALALKWSHEGHGGAPQDIARSTMEDRLRELGVLPEGSAPAPGGE